MKVSILSSLRPVFVFCAIWTSCTDVVESAKAPGSVLHLDKCENDADCKQYTTTQAHRVLCDKFNRTQPEGVCGCTGEYFEVKANKHLINPKPPEVLGYIDKFFNNPRIKKYGCHREPLRGASCVKGSTTCHQERIAPRPDGKKSLICRNINVGDEPGIIGVEDWRCVGQLREIKTFHNCSIDPSGYTVYNPPPNPCDFPDGQCLDASATFKESAYAKACVPKGSTIQDVDYYCHHDTDCMDPNAVCKFAFGFRHGSEQFNRRTCVCDKDAGFMFNIVEGKVKCTQGLRIHEICNKDEDCARPGTRVQIFCNPFGTSGFKTCQCDGDTVEYFEGETEKDANCKAVYDYGEECRPFEYTGRNGEKLHDCRRQSKTKTHFTGLVCPFGHFFTNCTCRTGSKWNMMPDGKCVPAYADLDQPCDPKGGNGLLKCNPIGHLECKKGSGSNKFICFCDKHSDRDTDFAYCKPRAQSKGYGEDCDENTLKCNPELNLICNVGKCECISDENIKDKPKTKECRYEKPGPDVKKSAASTYSSPGYSAIHLVLTTACILLYS